MRVMTPPDSTMMTDRSHSGEGPANEDFVRLLEDMAFSMALARLHDREAALDVAQETMLAVLRAASKGVILEQEKLEKYVCGTVRNLVCKHLRARYQQEHLAVPPPAPSPDAEEDLEEAERNCIVRRVFRGLARGDRQVLAMTIVSGLSPSQVADRLGVPPDTVRHRKMRALKRARTLFERLSGAATGTHPGARNRPV